MKGIKASAISVIVLLGLSLTAEAFANGGRHYRGHGHGHYRGSVSIGIGVGAPGWYGGPYYRPYYRPYYWPYAYSYPYPYYPSADVVVPSGPTTYVEQGQPAVGSAGPAAPAAAHWYFCNESQAYYPYVRECAGPWQRVAPQPPPS